MALTAKIPSEALMQDKFNSIMEELRDLKKRVSELEIGSVPVPKAEDGEEF